jgi:hypothetical protein
MKVTKQDLQILAGLIVTESELNKDSKVSLLNYVQHEASVYQLMALLLDGKISAVSESDKELIKDRFISSQYPQFIKEAQQFNEAVPTRKDVRAMKSFEAKTSLNAKSPSKPFFKKKAPVSGTNAMTHLKKPMGAAGKVGMVAGGVLAALALYKGAQLAFSKAHRDCVKTFGGKEKKVCLAKARFRMIEEKIKALAAAKSKCSEAKDPKSCAAKILNKINELKGQAATQKQIAQSA